MILDAILSILHFWAVIAVSGTLIAEFALVRSGVDAPRALTIARVDAAFGASAVVLFLAGFSRVFFGVGASGYYLGNHFFWAKIITFAVLGLCSIPPTLRYLKWRRAARQDASFAPAEGEVKSVRRWLVIELHLLALIVVFAALMARGFGTPG